MRKDLVLALSVALASLVFTSPRELHAAGNEQMITFSGQRISSIFDGLTPSRFALSSLLRRNKPRNMSRVWEEKLSDMHLGAHFLNACETGCVQTGCFGSFESHRSLLRLLYRRGGMRRRQQLQD